MKEWRQNFEMTKMWCDLWQGSNKDAKPLEKYILIALAY